MFFIGVRMRKKSLLLSLLLCIVFTFFASCESERAEYAVVFMVDGKFYCVAYAEEGDCVSSPEDPQKAGYVFDGWYRGEEKWNSNDSLNENITVYAKWTAYDNNIHEDSVENPDILQKPDTDSTVTPNISPNEDNSGKDGSDSAKPDDGVGEEQNESETPNADNNLQGEQTQDVTSHTHVYSGWITHTEVSCSAKGVEYRECTVCSEVLITKHIDKLPHDYNTEKKEPDCESAGYTVHTCGVCGANYTEIHDALGHDFGEWHTEVEPACTESGFMKRECSRCEAFEGLDTEARGHSMGDYAYLGNGEHISRCEHCDYSYTETCGSVETETEPTCTENGHITYTCAICAHSYTEDTNEATGHSYIGGECVLCGDTEYSLGLEYKLASDGSHYIVTGIGSCIDSDVIIPGEHGGLPVGAIAYRAFANCAEMLSVTIPESIKSIGKYAFVGCDALCRAEFESAEGWKRSESADGEGKISIHISDASEAAKYLTSVDLYCEYYWNKD